MGESIYSRRHRTVVDLMIESRQAANLRQADVAERMIFESANQQLVSDMESGQRRIDVAELHAYCEAVGVTLEQFIDRYTKRLSQPD